VIDARLFRSFFLLSSSPVGIQEVARVFSPLFPFVATRSDPSSDLASEMTAWRPGYPLAPFFTWDSSATRSYPDPVRAARLSLLLFFSFSLLFPSAGTCRWMCALSVRKRAAAKCSGISRKVGIRHSLFPFFFFVFSLPPSPRLCRITGIGDDL